MKYLHNKYVLALLALIFYIIWMFILPDYLAKITTSLMHYDFYVTMLNLSNIASFFATNSQNYVNQLNTCHEIIIYTLCFLILLLILSRLIKDDFIKLKNNINNYLQTILISFAIYYGINIIVNAITLLMQQMLGSSLESQNQANIESLINFSFYGLSMFIPICLIGPLVEELIFRKCFFTLIPNKILALVLSCLCFGLLHTISYDYSFIELIIITLPYFTAGIAFGYCYIKTNNIFASYLLHAGLNFISFCLILLM